MLSKSMRANYDGLGVDGYYQITGQHYRNPHNEGVRKACAVGMDLFLNDYLSQYNGKVSSQLRAFDLACGSGEASMAVREWWQRRNDASSSLHFHSVTIEACDPFTQQAYHQQTGQHCFNYSFQDISNGVLQQDDNTSYDICICSYAAHLIPDSLLFMTLYQLSLSCDYFMILSPHKKPIIGDSVACGWESICEERVVSHDRTHLRLFRSLNRQPQSTHST